MFFSLPHVYKVKQLKYTKLYLQLHTQTLVLSTYCTILCLFYFVLHVSALNLGRPQRATKRLDVYSVSGTLYIRKWQNIHINVSLCLNLFSVLIQGTHTVFLNLDLKTQSI